MMFFPKKFFLVLLLITAILSVGLFSCVEKKMTLKEAKQVSVSMKQHAFVLPPRSIEDILSVLNQSGNFNKKITDSIIKKADAKPPDTDDSGRLAEFYRDRGRSAKDLGRAKQELQDGRTALDYARKSDSMTPKGMSNLLKYLGSAETRLGNFKKGQEYFREGIKLFPTASHYHFLADSLFKMGDFKGGSEIIEKGVAFCTKNQQKFKGNRAAKFQADNARMNAIYFSSLGKYKKAETHWRNYQTLIEAFKTNRPSIYLMSLYKLAKNLKSQGRLIEAELQIREALKGAIAHAGKNSGLTASMASFLGELLLKQGRIDDAQKIIQASIECYEKAGVLNSSLASGKVRTLLGEVKFAKKDFIGAINQFQAVKKSMMLNQYFYNTKIIQNHNIILSFLISGRLKDAKKSISFFYKNLKPYVGGKQYKSAEILGLRAMVHSREKNEKQALEDFSMAMPMLFKEKGDENDFLKTFRQKLIVESYMELLFKIKSEDREADFNINAPAMIFNLCEQLNSSVVKGALGASGARAAAMNSELADLVRKEQDASKQINAMKRSLINIVSAGSGQQDKTTLSDLNTNLNALVKARQAILEEIESQFPKYSDFINPKPKGFEQIRDALKPKEAMLIMYPVANKVYLWGLPKTGPIEFSTVHVKDEALKDAVQTLRKSLAPTPEVFDDIPEFNLTLANDLYVQLFKPLENAWKNATDLLVVAPGALGQIPFGVLPTSLVDIGKEKELLYDNYRKVPWMIKRASITRLPSVSSFLTLRTLPEPKSDRLSFVGFGDPIFNLSQLTLADKNPLQKRMAVRGGPLSVRGIRKVDKKDVKLTTENTMKLGNLIRLPDTAEEILSIAKVMGADKIQSVFLGKLATEANVKQFDLSNVKVLAFASHGLVPGDLDGLTQPAIALTAPEVVTDFNEDGLLKMGEILKLRLNADWVILSACNTGAADGAGAEAISGLGRSFFYAGTRALLVTMWSVESTSAKKITTELFRYQNENTNLPRARALQKSMIKLIDNDTLDYKGKAIASYAHPFFWAPFIVVGDGG